MPKQYIGQNVQVHQKYYEDNVGSIICIFNYMVQMDVNTYELGLPDINDVRLITDLDTKSIHIRYKHIVPSDYIDVLSIFVNTPPVSVDLNISIKRLEMKGGTQLFFAKKDLCFKMIVPLDQNIMLEDLEQLMRVSEFIHRKFNNNELIKSSDVHGFKAYEAMDSHIIDVFFQSNNVQPQTAVVNQYIRQHYLQLNEIVRSENIELWGDLAILGKDLLGEIFSYLSLSDVIHN